MGAATILLVEDNPVNMELATDLLELAGYEVLRAGSAEEALAVAETALPDLILMDVRLPGMDGLTATARLKAQDSTRHIPVLALTAQAMKGDSQRALEAGCEDYITKPIDTRAFAGIIAAALQKA